MASRSPQNDEKGLCTSPLGDHVRQHPHNARFIYYYFLLVIPLSIKRIRGRRGYVRIPVLRNFWDAISASLPATNTQIPEYPKTLPWCPDVKQGTSKTHGLALGGCRPQYL